MQAIPRNPRFFRENAALDSAGRSMALNQPLFTAAFQVGFDKANCDAKVGPQPP
jgi:hypothetical protein